MMTGNTMKKVAATAAALGLVLTGTMAQAQDYSGHTPVLAIAEYITDPASGQMGGFELLRKDLGNGQLTHDFVYDDPRNAFWRNGSPEPSYIVRPDNATADVNVEDYEGWLQESLTAWESLQCSKMNLTRLGNGSVGNPGLVEFFFQTGILTLAFTEADLTQVGFKSGAEFPYFAANPNVLGVAFTLFWTDENGEFTDINDDGKFDVAIREIYYNDEFEWADNGLEGTQPDGTRLFDFPTVAIHEVGHGVSAAHFGSIGRQKGELVAHPRSIMNAIYGGTLRELAGRDKGSHCSNWAQWPNN